MARLFISGLHFSGPEISVASNSIPSYFQDNSRYIQPQQRDWCQPEGRRSVVTNRSFNASHIKFRGNYVKRDNDNTSRETFTLYL